MARQFSQALAIALLAVALGGCGAGDYGVDQHGRKVAAGELDQHWRVINYWAQWCAPCRREIPELNALAQQVRGAGVRVVGVNFDNLQGEELRQASQTMGIDYTVLAQNPAPRFDLPESQGLPVTYLIDPEGKVREQLLGEQTAASVLARLQAAGGL